MASHAGTSGHSCHLTLAEALESIENEDSEFDVIQIPPMLDELTDEEDMPNDIADEDWVPADVTGKMK